MDVREFFPEIEPYRAQHLKVSGLHTIYVEEIGNPEGVPVLFLHGGPGGGLTPSYRRFFDPRPSRVLPFDQRGAGKSPPHAELAQNTTSAPAPDIQTLPHALRIRRAT